MNTKQQILNDLGKPFDAFLVCALKDVIKLPYVVNSVIKHVKGLNSIYICTPQQIPKLTIDYPIFYYTDKQVLNVDPYKWAFRPNWIYQQMLKLFQNVTSSNFYLTIDCDSVIARDMHFFNNKKQPIWYIGWEQNHNPYYEFNKKMFNLEKTVEHTFIADMCFFNKNVINYMLNVYNLNIQSFIEKSFKLTDISCHISESNMYGQFVSQRIPDMYEIKKLKQFKNGKHNNNPDAIIWDDKEINDTISNHISGDYDVIQFHTWCLGLNNDWK